MTGSALLARDGRGPLDRHARLLFDLDDDGTVVAVNEPEPDPPPRPWIARGRTAMLVEARAHDDADLGDAAADLCRGVGP